MLRTANPYSLENKEGDTIILLCSLPKKPASSQSTVNSGGVICDHETGMEEENNPHSYD